MLRALAAVCAFVRVAAAAADQDVAVLRAAFPGSAVTPATAGVRIDNSWQEGRLSFPDTLADAPVYRVEGQAAAGSERCASENMHSGNFATTRLVRLRVFPWPRRPRVRIAVVHYSFEGARPALSCPSLSFLAVLDGGQVVQRIGLESMHHTALQRIDLTDVTGDTAPELVVESDSGGAGTHLSTMQVFELRRSRLAKLSGAVTRLESAYEGTETQTLDVEKSREQHGRALCFSRSRPAGSRAEPGCYARSRKVSE